MSGVIAVAAVAVFAAAPPPVEPDTFRAIRVQDQLSLSVGTSFMTFNETIVLTPIDVQKDKLQPGKPNLVHILIPPIWLRDGEIERSAFGIQRPYFQPSHGRVRRFVLMRPDGERVLAVDQITPDCRYVMTLEFGHVIPDKITVQVSFTSSSGINPTTEFRYTPSNDGHPVRSGPTESVVTNLRVTAESHLQPWRVLQGDKQLPLATPYSVNIDREVGHVIKFGEP
jgi:hypothetical protein